MRLLVFLGICLSLLGACTSTIDNASPATTSTSPGTIPLETHPLSAEALESCRSSAVSLCSRLEGCATSLLPLMYGSRAGCEAAIADECALRYEGPGAPATPTACDASALSCDDMRGVLVRELAVVESPASVLFQHCPVTKGELALGAACLHGSDCESGHCDNLPDGCGRCITAGGEGATCRANEGCAPGLHCLSLGAPGRCVRLRKQGERCSTDFPCAGLSCVNGVCQQYQKRGERCDEEGPLCDEANALACAGDLTCQPFIIDSKVTDECKVHMIDTPDVGTHACPWLVEETKKRGACKTASCRRFCRAP